LTNGVMDQRRSGKNVGETRERYVAALREADRQNFQPSLEFVRS